ncbi:hypothetical protein HYALB_00001858 [Hymenoscyphus albidus]|uniref:Uncharacterized protein n=1 Tax=Hymenoscyphus albidus TaxID=595503 RepID=A0A9N9LSY3_9HELO|nr:hypothetical protein HYALB_00001858 [Hymenoscyphus albidus]
MQFSILLTTSLFFLVTSASKNPRTSPEELQKRADVVVACEAGTFQNPGEDMKNVVCKAFAKCQSGSDADEETDPTTGKIINVAQCSGCPTQLGDLVNRCFYVQSTPAGIIRLPSSGSDVLDKMAGKNADDTTGKTIDNTTGNTVDNTADNTVDRTVDDTVDNTIDNTVDDSCLEDLEGLEFILFWEVCKNLALESAIFGANGRTA